MLRCLAPPRLATQKKRSRICKTLGRRISVIQVPELLIRCGAPRLRCRPPEALEGLAESSDEVGVAGLPPRRKTTTATRGKHGSSNGTPCSGACGAPRARGLEGVTIRRWEGAAVELANFKPHKAYWPPKFDDQVVKSALTDKHRHIQVGRLQMPAAHRSIGHPDEPGFMSAGNLC